MIRSARLAPALIPLLLAAACAPVAPPPSVGPAPGPVSAPAGMPALAASLDSLFEDSAFASARWGVLVRSLRTGETLYSRDAGKMFVPASNMKIVTGAAALEALGPDWRFRTSVEADGPVVDGELRGDLVVRGGGDPTFSTRFHPDPRAVFRGWADSLRARGIRRVAGGIAANDDALDDAPFGRGWAWDDLDAAYSAEVSALELNEGALDVRIVPGARQGEAPRVTLLPATGYVPVRVTATTGAPGTSTRLRVEREPAGAGIVVSGTIAGDTAGVTESVAVRHAALFFATVLREALVEAGIAVRGRAMEDDDAPAGVAPTRLFEHVSPPLSEVLKAFMKPSQNQIGEILLRTIGREGRGEGTARAGAAVVDSLLRVRGVPTRLLAQADGSGLSRYNLVAPEVLVAVLAAMDRSPNAAAWRASLPVMARDGTLQRRGSGTPLAGNVTAKTGTLSGVRALSGYLTTASGEPLVFSILVDHHTRSAAAADRIAEAALLRLHAAR